MHWRFVILALVIALPAFSQRLHQSFTFGGSGSDSINAAAVDPAGNIYVVGTTLSLDFPVRNAFQNKNSGTQLIVSADAGATWKPLTTPFPTPLLEPAIALDPTNSEIVYVASGNSVCKSTDGGLQFRCATIAFSSFQTSISSLAVDPRQALTVYASATVQGGVFKSVDGGETWADASQGLPDPRFIDSVTIDPFHSNVLYAWAGSGGYVSTNGASSWAQANLLPLAGDISGGIKFSFDPVKPGIIYGPAYTNSQVGVQKSSDGGVTWTELHMPFSSCCVVPDPKVSGLIYAVALSTVPGAPANFWKSSDGGSTWKSYPLPAQQYGAISVDPQNSQIILSGAARSVDGGQTWQATNASSQAQPVFASSPSLAYAIAPITSDAFLAKFLPDGKTLVFSTYFGGLDNDTGQGIALDASGDIWITGSTSSHDLPVTAGAFQTTLTGGTNSFVAKFSSDGNLQAATYLGGSNDDNNNGLGIAISPEGDPWLIGSRVSASLPGSVSGVLTELDPSAAWLLYTADIKGTFDPAGKGIAIDALGDVILTGSNYGDIPVTPGAFSSGVANSSSPKAFVLKLSPSGQVIYSSFFGGSRGAATPHGVSPQEDEHDYGVAVAVDGEGNAYVTGNTSAVDFPTTSDAFRTSFAGGCAFPAFSFYTGFIGTIDQWLVDDAFVVKLSPDGKTAIFSTLLGGSCYDRSTSIALDASGRIYVAGETDSGDFPQDLNVASAPDTRQFASFLSVFDPAGSALSFSTYLYAGAAPSVVAAAGIRLVVGSAGVGAQSQPNSGGSLLIPDTDGSIEQFEASRGRRLPFPLPRRR